MSKNVLEELTDMEKDTVIALSMDNDLFNSYMGSDDERMKELATYSLDSSVVNSIVKYFGLD
jgi:hypothetical protein